MDPEFAHHCATGSLRALQSAQWLLPWIQRYFKADYPSLRVQVWGQEFKNPIGLAAGFDKECKLYPVLSAFGFGFIECGTVTARPQPGNPSPRLFRLTEYSALINRLGFNNPGAAEVARTLTQLPLPQLPLGLNIGKSKVAPLSVALEDYIYSLERLWPFADYIAVNVSSPNTPGLRSLQKELEPLLSGIQAKNRSLAQTKNIPEKPVCVKIAPDLNEAELDPIIDCVLQNKAHFICSNTTLSRENVPNVAPQAGGLSGRPLEKRSTEMVRSLYRKVGKKAIIIGVGGIFTAEDAYRKIKAGATLVQLYTGWIYNGPGTPANIAQGLANLLAKDGVKNIAEVVGVM